MKKVLLVLFAVLLVAVAMPAHAGPTIDSSQAKLDLKSYTYDPAPAVPGGKIDFWATYENTGVALANASFDLQLEYPFYLDSSEFAVKRFGQTFKDVPVLAHYVIRVRDDAAEGDYNFTLRVYTSQYVYTEREFVVSVSNVATDFDVAVQDVTNKELSLAVANVGKNSAGALAVKTVGDNEYQSIVGTLAAGDYTVISVPINSKVLDNLKKTGLTVQVSYSDLNGFRRTVSKQIKLDNLAVVERLSENPLDVVSNNAKNNSGSMMNYLILAVIALAVGYFGRGWLMKRNAKRESGE